MPSARLIGWCAAGVTDLALTGGSEAPFSFGILKAWEAMRVVSPDTCRPFSKDRRGMILGEGAAMLVLEPLEAAQARGARIHAEIVGFGMSADACHITQPSAEGAARAMRAALRDAGLAPEQIGYINAHGTATPANDPTETAAIRSVFGAHAAKMPVSSTKSMHGHALGAAAALECLATVLALRDGVLPPTANFNEPDPDCDLDVIPNEARRAQVEYALSNSFAFGGLNAVLALRGAGTRCRPRRHSCGRKAKHDVRLGTLSPPEPLRSPRNRPARLRQPHPQPLRDESSPVDIASIARIIATAAATVCPTFRLLL